jgi:hypothetical protein
MTALDRLRDCELLNACVLSLIRLGHAFSCVNNGIVQKSASGPLHCWTEPKNRVQVVGVSLPSKNMPA